MHAHECEGQRNGRPVRGTEARRSRQMTSTSDALHHRHRRAAQRAADHDLQPRDGRHQCLLEEAELAVPQQAEAREDRREQHGHADDARRNELQVAALSRFLEHRAQAEAQHEQVQQRLAERRYDLRARPRVALEFAAARGCKSQSIGHRLHILRASARIWFAEPARFVTDGCAGQREEGFFERFGARSALELGGDPGDDRRRGR